LPALSLEIATPVPAPEMALKFNKISFVFNRIGFVERYFGTLCAAPYGG
jgi:hypothetical protein